MALGSIDLLAGQVSGAGGGTRRGAPMMPQVESGMGAARTGTTHGIPSFGMPGPFGYMSRQGQGGAGGGFQSILNNLMGQYAPDFRNFRTQSRLGRNAYNTLMSRMGGTQGDMRSQYGFDQRGLGLDRASLGVGRGAAQRGIRMTREEERLARAQLANSQQQANSDAGNAVVDTQSAATASGAMTAPGVRHDMGEIYGNLSMLRERNQLGFDRDLLGIRENRASHRDQLRTLGIEAQRLGIRDDELRQALRSGLRNLRLDTSMSANDILSGMSSNRADRAALSRQIFQQAVAMMGLG